MAATRNTIQRDLVLQAVLDLPLQIDTTNPIALEAALRRYNGKPMINSVNGKTESMEAVFPLVKKYGGLVVALTLDEAGIPSTAEGRLAIAERILSCAKAWGIAKKDIVFDPLALTVSADCQAAVETLKAVAAVRRELGLQTVHEETVRYIRRGYDTAVYFDAVKRLKAAGLEVVTHIILGLPGETPEMAVETTRQAVAAGTDGVKFHLLHVLRGTDLERDYLAGKFEALTLEEYGRILKQCLAVLPENTVVHRITGDGAKKDLVAPLWSGDKKRVLNYLHRVLEEGQGTGEIAKNSLPPC